MQTSMRRAIIAALPAALLTTMLTSAVDADARPGGPAPGTQSSTATKQDRFIVHFRSDSGAARSPRTASAAVADAAKNAGREVTEIRRLASGGRLIKTAQPLNPTETQALFASFARRDDVAAIETDVRMRSAYTPNDPGYPRQWHYFEPKAGVDLPAALDYASRDGAGVTVAVIDTGITTHPDLAANLVPGYDFISDPANAGDGNGRDANPTDPGDWSAAWDCGDPYSYPSSWHGTHVAGTIAAVTGNGIGVAGVAPRAKIQPIRVLGKCGGWLSDIADAVVWASGGVVTGVPTNLRPAQVINLSLSGYGRCGSTFQRSIDVAVSRGSSVIVAAGNEAVDASYVQPASCANTITVGAVDRSGNRAWYSNYGPKVDLAAPGGETDSSMSQGVLSTSNAGKSAPSAASYGSYMGTSMAAPHVAGVAALVRAERVLSPAGVEAHLKTYRDPIPGSCSGGCGTGLVSAARAARQANYYARVTDVPIPDRGVGTSSIYVNKPGAGSAGLRVGVRVLHLNRGQLTVSLIAPDGTAYLLKAASASDTGDHVISTYVRNVSAESVTGYWRLQARDTVRGTTGYIDSFTLQF
jgi:serine protease